MGSLGDAVRARDRAIADAGRWRSMRSLADGSVRTRLEDGSPVVHFASNDYLGLSQHPDVVAAAHHALDTYGAGAGASRLIVGHRPVHQELEAALAAWKGTGSALVFPTGFAANVGVLGALVGAGGRHDTVVFSDELNHASIIDGIRAARAHACVYPHLDLDRLADGLRTRSRRHAVVVSDAVFSMDGDLARSTTWPACAGSTTRCSCWTRPTPCWGPTLPPRPAATWSWSARCPRPWARSAGTWRATGRWSTCA